MGRPRKQFQSDVKSNIAIMAVFAILITAIGGPVTAIAQEADAKAPSQKKSKYPQIVKTSPVSGSTDVKTAIKEIKVTFDREMSGGMSWTGGPPLLPPVDKRRKAKWIDKKTCVLPVNLARGKFYRVGINAKSFGNFRSADGIPVPPTAIYFATEGASPRTKAMATIPKIAKIEPANGATDVDPGTEQISVTFNVPMGRGMSWTGGGPNFPESLNGKRAFWSKDKKTCTMPVKLKPNHQYKLGLNSLKFRNFASASGIALEPVVYQITTK